MDGARVGVMWMGGRAAAGRVDKGLGLLGLSRGGWGDYWDRGHLLCTLAPSRCHKRPPPCSSYTLVRLWVVWVWWLVVVGVGGGEEVRPVASHPALL